MNPRERYLATLLGEPADRPPYLLMWGPWGTAWQRWEKEGKPASVTDHRTIFEPDPLPWVAPVNCGPCPRRPIEVIEEDETSVVYYDTWGIKRRNFKHQESMSDFLEFPVKSRADWEAYKKAWLDPEHPERLAGDWIEQGRRCMDEGVPIQMGYFPDVGIFGGVRWLLGDEEGCLAFCTEPDLVHEIMEHLTTLYLHVFGQVVRELRVDVVHIWEDMCGRTGPLIGPDQWREFMGPCYRRIKAFAESNGIPVLSVDTDGDPDLITPPMIETGVNLLFPLEVAAGCDVNAWRARYPELGLLGGIDKRALAEGPDAIDAELERVRPAVEAGRYIADLDHLVPDDVSWDNYCHYAKALKRLVGAA